MALDSIYLPYITSIEVSNVTTLFAIGEPFSLGTKGQIKAYWKKDGATGSDVLSENQINNYVRISPSIGTPLTKENSQVYIEYEYERINRRVTYAITVDENLIKEYHTVIGKVTISNEDGSIKDISVNATNLTDVTQLKKNNIEEITLNVGNKVPNIVNVMVVLYKRQYANSNDITLVGYRWLSASYINEVENEYLSTKMSIAETGTTHGTELVKNINYTDNKQVITLKDINGDEAVDTYTFNYKINSSIESQETPVTPSVPEEDKPTESNPNVDVRPVEPESGGTETGGTTSTNTTVIVSNKISVTTTKNYKLVKGSSSVVYGSYTAESLGYTPYYIVDSNFVTKVNGENTLKEGVTLNQKNCVGILDLGNESTGRNARIILFKNIANPNTGSNNGTIKFPHYVDGLANRINNCTFGTLYDNHLFVSGNSDFPNFDWHTDNVNIGQIDESYDIDSVTDFTYFSDLNYCKYGSSNTAVVGYDVYSDGDLIIHKQESSEEPSMYYRTLKYANAMNSSGEIVVSVDGSNLYQETYPSKTLNQNGEGAISHKLICNYLGDSLVVTKNGLKKLYSKSVSSSHETYLQDMSTLINPKILSENIRQSMLFTYNKRLILQTSRGLYIAEKGINPNNNEYEWFFEDIKAQGYFERENELYFVTQSEDNQRPMLSKFEDGKDEDLRVDKHLIVGIPKGGLAISEDKKGFVVYKELIQKIKEGTKIYFCTNTDSRQDLQQIFHAYIGDITNEDSESGIVMKPMEDGQTLLIKSNGTPEGISQLESFKNILYSGDRRYYIDYQNGSGNSAKINVPFEIKVINDPMVDFTSYKIQFIEKRDKEDVILKVGDITLPCRLSYKLNNEELATITDIDIENSSFKLKDTFNNYINPIIYNNGVSRDGSRECRIIETENVESYYETKPYDLGNITYMKTIKSFVIANDVALNSSIQLGYLASNHVGTMKNSVLANGSSQLQIDKYSTSLIQFTYDRLPHLYSKKVNIPKVNYIKFRMSNLGNHNMVLSQLAVQFLLAQTTMKGIR